MVPFSADATLPLAIKKSDAFSLTISWKDGHQSLYRFFDLRNACLCAACVDERTGARVLDPQSIPHDIHPVSANPVGRYGIQWVWSDGHSTGIFSFDYLRSLCPCEACQAEGAG